MIHLLLRLIIRLHYFSVSKNKWCALHNLKCTNILSIWLLKRLSDMSEIMKAQTHWLPHWKASLWKAVKSNSGCRTLHYTSLSKGTSAIVPFHRFSMLITTTEWNLELPAPATAVGPSPVLSEWGWPFFLLPFPPAHRQSHIEVQLQLLIQTE